MTAEPSLWERFSRNRGAIVGLAIVVCIVLMTIAAPILYPGDPGEMVAQPFIWPFSNPAFPLGSDMLGRDLAAQIFHGAHESLLIGASATAGGRGPGRHRQCTGGTARVPVKLPVWGACTPVRTANARLACRQSQPCGCEVLR